jgi:hypothetical protein
MSIRGADLVVRHLEAQGVRHVFGVPGAKIDRVYDALTGSRIQTVVCRGVGLRAQVQDLADVRIAMPETAAFLQADLSQDPSRDLDVAEWGGRRTAQV